MNAPLVATDANFWIAAVSLAVSFGLGVNTIVRGVKSHKLGVEKTVTDTQDKQFVRTLSALESLNKILTDENKTLRALSAQERDARESLEEELRQVREENANLKVYISSNGMSLPRHL